MVQKEAACWRPVGKESCFRQASQWAGLRNIADRVGLRIKDMIEEIEPTPERSNRPLSYRNEVRKDHVTKKIRATRDGLNRELGGMKDEAQRLRQIGANGFHEIPQIFGGIAHNHDVVNVADIALDFEFMLTKSIQFIQK